MNFQRCMINIIMAIEVVCYKPSTKLSSKLFEKLYFYIEKQL